MGISQNTMDRIFRGVRKIEKMEISSQYIPAENPDVSESLFVVVTGPKVGQYYPGTVTYRNPDFPDQQTDNKFTDATVYDPELFIWIEAINDEPLVKGSRYIGKFTTTHLDDVNATIYPVYTVVYTPPVGYGYSGSNVPDKPSISSVTWNGQIDTSASGCTLTKTLGTYYLVDDESIGMLLVVTPSSSAVALGPFPLHGVISVTIPSQSGSISGTAGSCAISGTVTVPAQNVNVDLSTGTACP